ncbi:MAG TPA: TonB-dependent receptor [Cyclobacteriaceae bacterium]|nr:TonB-dependent receptor [Cyclobacteriaceae bacterium]
MRKLLLISLLTIISGAAIAQEKVVSGKITGKEDGQGIPGANISVPGSSKGTVSAVDGSYRINLSASENTLVISFIGYITQTIAVGERSVIDVVLEMDDKVLDEVVVVGYGVQKKSDLTGSISSVKETELLKIPSFNAAQSLQGKVAGVQVYNSSGAPGASPVVRVRGVGTFNNSSPIYVVDGVILDDISFLNSADIQSMEVLKDASSTAIFGSRGANGVIIITTKQGKMGQEKAVVNFTSEYSLQQVGKTIDMVNGKQFGALTNEIIPGTYNNLNALPNTDWQNLIFRTAPIQNYQLSVNGASSKSQYYFGVGYFNQQGIVPKSSYERLTLKFNNTYMLTDNIKVGNNITFAPSQQQNAPDVVYAAYRAQPLRAPYYADGTFGAVPNVGNPLAALEYSNSFNKTMRLVGNMFTDVKFLKDFNFHSSFGVDLNFGRSSNYTPAYTVYNPDGTPNQQQNLLSSLSKGTSNSSTWLWENTVTYMKEIGEHKFNVLGGYTMQQTTNEFINIAGSNIIRDLPELRYLNNPNYFYDPTSTPVVNNLAAINNGVDANLYYSLISYLFRVNYTWKDKYLLTASFRRDGSSKFSPANRWGNFPSFALGWNVFNESFMENIKAITNLKVRASWGTIGNEKINYLKQYSLITANGNTSPVFGTANNLVSGATFDVSGNPNLVWETTSQTDIGVEIGFFNNRLTGEFDYFNKQTKDILVPLRTQGYFGNGNGALITVNAGTVLNRGVEFNVAWQDEIKGIKYRVGILGNTLHNEVLAVGGSKGIDSTLVGGFLGNGQAATLSRVGLPIGAFYGYKTAGVFQNAAQLNATPHDANADVGDLIFVDTNKDGKITAADRTYLGSPIPTLIYGFNMMVGYKGLEIMADFQGQTGNKILNAKEIVRPDPYNFEKHVINRWTGEGTSNTEPRASFGGYNYSISDRFIQDGSYLRLRSLTIGYTLPEAWTTKMRVKQVKFYARGTNVFTIAKFTGYSPDFGSSDVLSNNIDYGSYPVAKVYTLGLNVTF